MSKKRKQKKLENSIKIALVILLIISIILFIILSIILKRTKTQERSGVYVRPENISLISQDEFFRKYGGSVSKDYIIQKITSLVYYISDNKEKIDNMETDQIAEEYKNNEKELKQTGFENQEDYENIIKEIKKQGKKEAELSYVEILTENIKRNNGFTIADLVVKYTQLEKIELSIQISNTRNQSEPLVRFKTK